MNPTISLTMIVRNEEENLARCLDSVTGEVDEIVIVDTGSTDKTVEVARRYADKVYFFRWAGDFSAARNYALSRANSRWIFYLDADEELDTPAGGLRNLVSGGGGIEAFLLPLHNRTGDFSGDYGRSMVLRLFRNSPEYFFLGKIHEQVVVARPESVSIAPGPVIWHRPVPARELKRKQGRNLAMLRRAAAEDPSNPFLQYYLGLEWLGLGKAKLALPCFEEACRQLTDRHILFRSPAILCLISCLKALGRLDEAIRACLEESSRYPLFTDLFFEGGVLFELKGEYQIAVKWFREAVNCGSPPALFKHRNGAGGFLALYHLGYCHEKLGLAKEAIEYYHRALSSNPDYIYPAYNLFLLYLAHQGPRGAFKTLREEGHLVHPGRAAALADLFFEAGCPELACACTVESGADSPAQEPAQLLRRVKHLVYAGRTEEALSLAEGATERGGQPDPDLAAVKVVALILKGDYAGARQEALDLWRIPGCRGEGLAMLNLSSLALRGAWCGHMEKAREPAALKITLEILDNFLRQHPRGLGEGGPVTMPNRAALVRSAIEFLSRLSPGGCLALSDYLLEKARATRSMMDLKYTPAGSLYQ